MIAPTTPAPTPEATWHRCSDITGRGSNRGRCTREPGHLGPHSRDPALAPTPPAASVGERTLLDALEVMPATDDRQPWEEGSAYRESDDDWAQRNPSAIRWLIDNHRAIRAALSGSAPPEPGQTRAEQEDAGTVPWGYGWYDDGGKKRASGYLPTVDTLRDVSGDAFPLYRAAPPEAGQERMDDELQRGKDELRRLMNAIWRAEFLKAAPNWKPLDDLPGMISQIDNMYAGIRGQRDQARWDLHNKSAAAPVPDAGAEDRYLPGERCNCGLPKGSNAEGEHHEFCLFKGTPMLTASGDAS